MVTTVAIFGSQILNNAPARGDSRTISSAAPPHVREPRQDESVGSAEFRRLRPIIGNLRLDDNQVLGVARAPEAVLQ